jgi:hypothetical protein
MERPEDFRELTPPLAGLRTLLEKVRLGARYSEAAKCCAELRVKRFDDLHLELVWKALSTSLSLILSRTNGSGSSVADETKLWAYAANDSGPSFGSSSDQSPEPEPLDPGGSAAGARTSAGRQT